MFCPECGKKNAEGAQFCEHCGEKIVSDVKVVLPKKPRRKLSKKTVIITSVILAIVVILVVGGIVLSNMFKPSKIASNYFSALMSNDTDKIYDFIDVPDGEFTTKEIFSEVIDMENVDMINYQVASEEISSDGLSAQVTISYTLKKSQTPLTTTIYLVKDKKNKLLIFDNWKISDGSSLVLEDYEISVYKNAKIKLEGVEVSEDYKKDNDSDRYDTYVIPSLFKGEYDVEITLENGLSMTTSLDTDGYSSSITSFDLSDDNEKALTDSSKDVIQKLYKSALDGKSFNDIKSEYNYEGAELSDLEDAYDSFKNSIGNSGLKEFSLTDLEVDRYSVTDDGYFYVSLTAEYKYTVTEYFSDDTVSKNDDDTMYLTFDYKDGFKLVDFSSLATYFSRY